MSNLEQSDAQVAAVSKHPRVSLSDIKAEIIGIYFMTGHQFWQQAAMTKQDAPQIDVRSLGSLTICMVVTKNGTTIVGQSAPADPSNFNPEIGMKLALEDCERQLWPRMGWALKQKLYEERMADAGR